MNKHWLTSFGLVILFLFPTPHAFVGLLDGDTFLIVKKTGDGNAVIFGCPVGQALQDFNSVSGSYTCAAISGGSGAGDGNIYSFGIMSKDNNRFLIDVNATGKDIITDRNVWANKYRLTNGSYIWSDTQNILNFINLGGWGLQFNTSGGMLDINPSDLSKKVRFYSGGGEGGLVFRTSTIVGGENATTEVPLTVKGVLNQTDNLQEWQNSTGTVLAFVGKNGDINSTGVLKSDANKLCDNLKCYTISDLNVVGSGGIDTNWQTSWVIFDANMKAYYMLIGNYMTKAMIDGNGYLTWVQVDGNVKNWLDGNLSNYMTIAGVDGNVKTWIDGNLANYYTKSQSDANWAKYLLLTSVQNWMTKAMIDGNNYMTKTQTDGNYVARNTWTTIDNYPTACSAGQYVSQIGDTLTCGTPSGGGTDTNWQTSWTTFDLNMRNTYWRQIDLNKWIDQNLQTKATVLFNKLAVGSTSPTFNFDVVGAIGDLGGGNRVNSAFLEDHINYSGVYLGYKEYGEEGPVAGIVAASTGGALSSLSFWTYDGSWDERALLNETGFNLKYGVFSSAGTGGVTDTYDSSLGGQIVVTGGIVTEITDDPSDLNFKSNVKSLSLDVNKFSNLISSQWDWNTIKTGKGYGLIAQDIEKVYPELVKQGQKKEFLGWEDENKAYMFKEDCNKAELKPAQMCERIMIDENTIIKEGTKVFYQTIKAPVWKTTTYKTIDYLGIIALQIKKTQELEKDNNLMETQIMKLTNCILSGKDLNAVKVCVGK